MEEPPVSTLMMRLQNRCEKHQVSRAFDTKILWIKKDDSYVARLDWSWLHMAEDFFHGVRKCLHGSNAADLESGTWYKTYMQLLDMVVNHHLIDRAAIV